MDVRFSLRLLSFVVLAGCSGGGSASSPAAGAAGGSLLPSSLSAVPIQTVGSFCNLKGHARSPISHVIIVFMENRTFDNVFNGFPNADSAQSGKTSTGQTVALHPSPYEYPEDPSHTYQSLSTEYDDGKMDGFNLNTVNATVAGGATLPTPNTFVYGYLPQAEVAPYWTLAKQYATADRMFSSQLAPSFPGHQYIIAGQSDRAIGDPANTNPLYTTEINTIWGCDDPPGTTEQRLSEKDVVINPGPFPCFDYATLGDVLDAGHVSWSYYTGFVNGVDLDGQVSAYDAIRHIRYGPDWTADVKSPEYRFFADVTAGTLPSVSWVTPPAAASDHAGTLNSSGPAWVTAIYSAIASSPYYANTAILVTWDDSGGWYDHVPPPGFNGLEPGLRVPLIAISPYAKHGYVSHAVHTYGSILHAIEENFGVASLNTDDKTADDLSDMFDFSQKPVPAIAVTSNYTLAQIEALVANGPVDDDK